MIFDKYASLFYYFGNGSQNFLCFDQVPVVYRVDTFFHCIHHYQEMNAIYVFL